MKYILCSLSYRFELLRYFKLLSRNYEYMQYIKKSNMDSIQSWFKQYVAIIVFLFHLNNLR